MGFQEEVDFLLMPAEMAAAETLNAAGEELNSACTNPFSGVLQDVAEVRRAGWHGDIRQ